MGVGADQGVAVGPPVVGDEDHPRQVLQIDLVTDAGARRYHPKAVEGLLRPAQKLVALDVALVLDVDVLVEGVRPAGDLGDHRVVDDQLDRDQRVDPCRVTAECSHRVAHGRQVDHTGHTGEVLHEDPLGSQDDLRGVLGPETVPFGMSAPAALTR